MDIADHLSPLDAMFLELEQADDSAHMHIGAVAVFDALPDGGAPTLEHVAQRLEDRFDAVPRYRQRLSSVRTGGLSWPTMGGRPELRRSRSPAARGAAGAWRRRRAVRLDR
jgi:hypothetical protein